MHLSEALTARGLALLDAHKYAEAKDIFVNQTKVCPRDQSGFVNASAACQHLHQYREAEQWLKHAWRRWQTTDIAYNLGTVFAAIGQWRDAETWLRRALELDGTNGHAWHALSSVQLSAGNWSEGWANNRWRSTTTPGYRSAPWPDGTEECSLLILRDFGIGDEMFFLRWYAECERRMKSVVYAPDLRLLPMLKRAGFNAVEGHPVTDLFCASVDLPFLLGMKDGDAVPPTIALKTDARRVRKWQAWLEEQGPRPWVGVTWRSGTRNEKSLFKEAPLPLLQRYLKSFKGTVIAIQRMEPEAVPWPSIPEPAVSDPDEMLALMNLLDEYICTSNTNLHLRHALGLKSRVLVPSPPDWRWMREGDESPWFPGTKVYRQKPSGDWIHAIAQATGDMFYGR